jgi:hypothetical protein
MHKVNNNTTAHNNEHRQYRVFLKPSGDWSSEPGDGTRYEPEVFFIKGGAIGIETAGRVVVKSIEAWTSHSQRSVLQQCKAWFSAIIRRMQ